jgi:hypothetical protein
VGLFKRLFGYGREPIRPSSAEDALAAFRAESDRIARAGTVDQAHYTQHVERVKELKRTRQHDEAISLLLRLVDATEAEAEAAGRGWGVAPWYYEQLAIVYRKERRFADEVEILRRYGAQAKAPGRGPSKLAERLAKAEALYRKEVSGDA